VKQNPERVNLLVGQLTTIQLGFLKPSHRPVGPLACPARFERATYALEAVKMRLNNSRNNGLSLARTGVQYAPRSAVRSGNGWKLGGIGRRSSGWTWDLSGKPTFLSVLLRDGWVAAIDPKQTIIQN